VKDYLDFANLKGSLEILDRYGIRYALLSTSSPAGYLLRHDADWHTIYSDDVATIFERTSAPVISQTR
jgi:hypothetical protein